MDAPSDIRRVTGALLLLLALGGPPLAAADDDVDRGVDSRPGGVPVFTAAETDAQAAVEAARLTLTEFLADPHQAWLRAHLGEARALMIVPKLVRAGLGFFGGSGGRGLLLVRDPESGWSMPAFYLLGAASVGLEAGVQRVEALLLANSEAGVQALMHGRLQLGVGASIAAGPLGQGVQAASADVLVFERAMGLYGGLVIEGTGIVVDTARNRAYYDAPVEVEAILRERSVSNPAAEPLIRALRDGVSG